MVQINIGHEMYSDSESDCADGHSVLFVYFFCQLVDWMDQNASDCDKVGLLSASRLNSL